MTVGVFAIITSALGFIGSHYKKWCLSAYVFFGAIISTIQLILVLVMFVDAGGIVDRIEAYDQKDGETWITRSISMLCVDTHLASVVVSNVWDPVSLCVQG